MCNYWIKGDFFREILAKNIERISLSFCILSEFDSHKRKIVFDEKILRDTDKKECQFSVYFCDFLVLDGKRLIN